MTTSVTTRLRMKRRLTLHHLFLRRHHPRCRFQCRHLRRHLEWCFPRWFPFTHLPLYYVRYLTHESLHTPTFSATMGDTGIEGESRGRREQGSAGRSHRRY